MIAIYAKLCTLIGIGLLCSYLKRIQCLCS